MTIPLSSSSQASSLSFPHASSGNPSINKWPLVPLGEVVHHRKEFIQIDDLETYRRCRVQLHVQGIVLRDTVPGIEIKTKKQQVCHAEEFLVAEIDAKVGGFGIVPIDLEGAIVSSHYFLFAIDKSRLDPAFLGYFIRTPAFIQQVAAQGSTNYAAIRPSHVLRYRIPLPPLSEQKRIVAGIDGLVAKIQKASDIQMIKTAEVKALFSSLLAHEWEDRSGWMSKPIGDLVNTVSGQVDPQLEPYASLPHINGESIQSATCRLLTWRSAVDDGMKSGKYHFQAGAILYSKIRPYLRKAVEMPFEGICSADIYAFEKISSELVSRFFMYSLIAPPFATYANALSGRTRMPKLNQNQLFAYRLEYPDLPEQRRIVSHLDSLLTKATTLKKLQSEIATELDALLPSLLHRTFGGGTA